MKEKISLEKNLAEIRKIVEKMQKGVSDFDQQMTLFKEGTRLIDVCREYLNESELKVQQLIQGKESPFSAEE